MSAKIKKYPTDLMTITNHCKKITNHYSILYPEVKKKFSTYTVAQQKVIEKDALFIAENYEYYQSPHSELLRQLLRFFWIACTFFVNTAFFRQINPVKSISILTQVLIIIVLGYVIDDLFRLRKAREKNRIFLITKIIIEIIAEENSKRKN